MMWCIQCAHELTDCECNDLEERLANLFGSCAEMAALQNLQARKVKRRFEQPLESTRSDA
ncbi:MAG TPA: hypothetical protein VMT00_03100 [Thermoanaerobaculia bacterium]|nr:hypothetical protein [Thermoanaerobaculia bacterium]